jgi:hypothetical protein
MPISLLHFWMRMVCGWTLAFITFQIAHADDPDRARLSPMIRRALAWLPEDTETVVAAQSFVISAPDPDAAAEPTAEQSNHAINDATPLVALGALGEQEMAEYLKPLVERKVLLALRGGRNYEWVSGTLPTYRTEGCAIVVFEKDLGETGTEWENTLRAGPGKIRKLAGRKVVAFPPTKAMRPARSSKWPGKLGVYLAVLNSNTIVCATSDKYLEEVFERIDTPPAGRALPDSLHEWNHVDSTAPFWIVRHISNPNEAPRVIDGVTWTLTKDRFQAVYLSVAGGEDRAAAAVRRRWQPDNLPVHPTIERHGDGTVIVSSTTEKLGSEALFWFAMNRYWLEAETGDSGTD